jgi:CBS domain-containing protein
MIRVADVMTRSVRTMTPNESVIQAAQAMDELDVGAIPVCDGSRLVGMVTDRDLVVRSIAQARVPQATPLHEVMSRGVCCCYEDEPVEVVVGRMREERIRRVPVLDRDDHVVGIVSLGDIAVKDSDVVAGRTLEKISEPARSGQSQAGGRAAAK